MKIVESDNFEDGFNALIEKMESDIGPIKYMAPIKEQGNRLLYFVETQAGKELVLNVEIVKEGNKIGVRFHGNFIK